MPLTPFSAQRQMLMPQLFRQAMNFGQTGAGGLSSRGIFDPNLAEAMRNQAFGQAINAGSMGLTNLAGQEAGWLENRRQFDEQMSFNEAQLQLQRDMFNAEKRAGKTNIWDVVGGIGGLLPGVGSIFQGLGALRQANNFGGMFGGTQQSNYFKPIQDNYGYGNWG